MPCTLPLYAGPRASAPSPFHLPLANNLALPPHFKPCSLTRLALMPVPRVELAPDVYEQKLPYCALQLRSLQYLDITGGCSQCCVSMPCMRGDAAICM